MRKRRTPVRRPYDPELLRPYTSGWVAFSPDQTQVVGAGETLEEVLRQAKEKGFPHPIFLKIIPPDQLHI